MSKNDDRLIRCPRLGGEVTFAYCRQENNSLPCPRTLRCWQVYFPVEAYLREILTVDEWTRCFETPPKDKITTIFEIVDKLKKQKGL
jgi:hypothetical protein